MPGSLKGLIQSLGQTGAPGIVVGRVISESPVQVVLDDDEQITMSAASLIIPSGKKRLIEKGERLYLLSFCNDKLYYVLDRV